VALGSCGGQRRRLRGGGTAARVRHQQQSAVSSSTSTSEKPQHGEGAAPVASSRPTDELAPLPVWWISFQQFSSVVPNLTLGLVSAVLLQLAVNATAPENLRGRYLGIAAAAGTAAEITQPIWGALSDRSRSRWGRRRLYVVIGQLGSTAALCLMASWPCPRTCLSSRATPCTSSSL
jgi:hypothetical protein